MPYLDQAHSSTDLASIATSSFCFSNCRSPCSYSFTSKDMYSRTRSRTSARPTNKVEHDKTVGKIGTGESKRFRTHLSKVMQAGQGGTG